MIVLNDHVLDLTNGLSDAKKLVQTILQTNEDVYVKELKGGITNMLLYARTESNIEVLVRAFGKGTSSFIDRKREFQVHNELQKINLAPKLYGKFANGLVYGYLRGTTSTPNDLSKPDVMSGVARRLAQWHSKLDVEVVRSELAKQNSSLGDFFSILKSWVDQCPENVLPINSNELKNEFNNLKKRIGSRGGPIVMGHCDLLSANILLPEKEGDLASFIDYEYAAPCPRAFDIANHFQEWQGYECDKSRVPRPSINDEKLVFWVTEYLTAYNEMSNTNYTVEEVVTELQNWWGMPGFYWGVWSAIQSRESSIDFNYKEYARERFGEYQRTNE